jgi:20S proteasome alpha/beta subunit
MTVIVGVLCDGGVAIAADRQVTANAFVPLNQPQTLQTSVASIIKISSIEKDVLLGVSGIPPIGDEYEQTIKDHYSRFSTGLYENATRKLKDEIRTIINEHIKTAALLVQVIGQAHAYSQAVCECLLAANFRDGIKLIQILQHGAFDVAKPEMPIKVIGSGQFHADPFMVFLKNTFWPTGLPTVQQGVLAACWAVDYAIEVGAPHVGRDIDAFTLAPNGKGRVRAEKVMDDQIKNHRQFIAAGRESLRELARVHHTSPTDATQIPTMVR